MPCDLDAVGMIEQFRSGKMTPVDAFEASMEEIVRRDDVLNAMTHLSSSARIEAEASARRWRQHDPRGPLDGVPITVKDNLAVAGMPATFGSRAYREFIPKVDELPILRARKAGAVVIGKTNLPEFALEGYTDNALFGATGNPFDPDLTPGGSTGGGAVSVAAGYAPVALGTDGGGSLRRPAAHCGLVALKTTTGRVPRLNGLPQLLFDFEIAGALTRTMRDTRLFYKVMAGKDDLVQASHLPTYKAKRAPLKILAIETLGDAPLDPEIAKSFRAFLAALEEQGHIVSAGSLPLSVDRLAEVWPKIAACHLAKLFSDCPDVAAAASPKYRQMAELAHTLSASQLLDILDRVAVLRRDIATLFKDADIIATPTIAALAWPKTESFPPVIDGKPVGPRGHAVYTGWVNAAGVPALALPTSPASDGRRIGAQLIAPFGADGLLLALGDQISEALR
jgi:aspartyl-tRNA(Asn)/glutamyl-tRNA(Gln) amidotransferase subunit A